MVDDIFFLDIVTKFKAVKEKLFVFMGHMVKGSNIGTGAILYSVKEITEYTEF